jgi:benzoyl-CoA reductase/2-hydroxyglutaryl-CoA dehydratase subunit BcrC/BadD/HgdB
MRKVYTRSFVLFLLMLAATGCANVWYLDDKAKVTVLSKTYPPRDQDALIDVYVTSLPAKGYIEFAQIRANSVNDDRNIKEIRSAARQIGADGIILLRSNKTYSIENTNIAENPSYGYTAIAIKYKID